MLPVQQPAGRASNEVSQIQYRGRMLGAKQNIDQGEPNQGAPAPREGGKDKSDDPKCEQPCQDPRICFRKYGLQPLH